MTPDCSTCGYAVEILRSCYVSAWQLLPPPLPPTRGYYFFVPETTPFAPVLTYLGSSNWWSKATRETAVLGEVPGYRRTYRTGAALVTPPPVLQGSADCLSQGETTTPDPSKTLIAGVPASCWTSKRLTPPVDPIPGLMRSMYTSNGLASYSPGSPIPTWASDLIGGPALSQANPSLRPVAVTVPGSTAIGAGFTRTAGGVQALSLPTTLALGEKWSLSFGLVLGSGITGPAGIGAFVGSPTGPQTLAADGVQQTATTASQTVTAFATLSPGQAYVVQATSDGETVTLFVNGNQVARFGVGDAAATLDGVALWSHDAVIGQAAILTSFLVAVGKPDPAVTGLVRVLAANLLPPLGP